MDFNEMATSIKQMREEITGLKSKINSLEKLINPIQPLAINKYWLLLLNHDWHYKYTEDPTVYNRGERDEVLISKHANDSAIHKEMLNDFRAYKNNSGAKPVLAKYIHRQY